MKSLEWADAALVSLREQWRTQSLGTIWLRPGDWFDPAVDAVVSAVHVDDGVLDAVEALGRARGESGVGVGETVDDLACLYRITEDGEPPLDVVRALTEGWASAGAAPIPGTCMDPESGLPTMEYLSVRLTEAYTAAARAGVRPEETLCFVLVDVAVAGIPPWHRMARSAAVGRAFEVAFGAGHPAASLGGGVFALLHQAGPGVGDAIARLSRQILTQAAELGVTDLMRQPPRVWIEAVPAEHRDAVALLAMRRPA